MYLHFCDNTQQPTNNWMFKIKSVRADLISKFKKTFHPFQNICIDESLLLFKGRLAFKQYNPKKRSRFEMKTFGICDCKTGYVIDVVPYSGKQSHLAVNGILGASGEIVMHLMKNFFEKGHIVYMDNWFTSPILFELLESKGTGAVGTVRKNRKHYPKFPAIKKKGEMATMHTDTMLALSWKDKQQVYMLSTAHSGTLVKQTRNRPKKPKAIYEYNKNMDLVDKCNMQVSFTKTVRKTLKWYKKLFFHFLVLTIYNCYVLYKITTGKKPSVVQILS